MYASLSSFLLVVVRHRSEEATIRPRNAISRRPPLLPSSAVVENASNFVERAMKLLQSIHPKHVWLPSFPS